MARDTLHQRMIQRLVETVPGMKANGFWADIRALAQSEGADVGKYAFLPDAHRINRDDHVIEIHEVVVTNDPSRDALFQMAELWFDWDAEGSDWEVTLTIHREGAEPQRYDLRYWWNQGEAEISRLSAHPDHVVEG